MTLQQSMAGKRVVITGATSGIGTEIARRLAGFGAELVLGCRDLDRGARVAAELTRAAGGAAPTVMSLDTSSRASILAFARDYRARFPRLDVLVNDAGTYRPKRQLSVDGIELTFATNVLGYHLLTRELLAVLTASAPARIVNVASEFATAPDFDDLQFARRSYSGQAAYSQSKACDRLLTWALARRLAGTGVTANAMAPGLVMTGLYRDTPSALRLLLGVVARFVGSDAAAGADTAVWLASSPEVAAASGSFFVKRKEVRCRFRSPELEDRLWTVCEDLVRAREA